MPFLLFRSLVLFVLLGAPSVAQIAPRFWMTWGLGSTGPCSICAYTPTGTQIYGFNLGNAWMPRAVKHKAGVIGVIDAGNSSVSIFSLTMPLVTQPVVGLKDLAISPAGDFLVSRSLLFSNTQIDRYSIAGNLLQSVPLPTMSNPESIRSDRQGRAWSTDSLSYTIRLIDFATSSVASYVVGIAPYTTLSPLEMDHEDRGWIAVTDGTGNGFIRRVVGGFGVDFTLNVTDFVAMDIDVCGRLHVLRRIAGSEFVEIRSTATGAIITTVPISGPGTHFNMVMDTAGNYWMLQQPIPTTIKCFSADGVLLSTINGGLGTGLEGGDGGGVHMINCDPFSDADLDGVTNEEESLLGSDPGDPTSVPGNFSVAAPPVVGQSFLLTLNSPNDAGASYFCGLSASMNVGISLPAPDCRTIPLDLDAALQWWLSPLNTLAAGQTGTLDPAGQATLSVLLPQATGGVPVTFAFVTLGSSLSGIRSISTPLTLTLP